MVAETELKNRPVKVAHVITRLILGGAQENTLYTVLGLLPDRRWEVVLISGPETGPEGDIRKHIPSCPPVRWVREMVRNINPAKDLAALWALWRMFRREKFDIVHTHSSKAGILGRLAAKLAGVRVVVHTIHGLAFDEYQPGWKNRLFVRLERICAGLTDGLIAVSEGMREHAVRYGVVPGPEKIRVVYSGVDLALYEPKAVDIRLVRRQQSLPEKKFLVAKVARFFDFKGHEFLPELARQLMPACPELVFVLVGDGPLREEFTRRVREAGCEQMFFFTGLVPPARVPGILEACDALVHLSLREGLARVVPQAMLAAKPVVVFDTAGAGEIVEDGGTGFVLPAGRTQEAAEKIRFLYENRECAARMGKAARSRAEKLFDKDAMVRDIAALYAELLQKKQPS